mmetsp:Transcript_14498/g.35498  ORF Transcript_14498/g.35498 Transcript_14498/m.35498 type:complete len:151 (-) Transcript_14498:435-887(-)
MSYDDLVNVFWRSHDSSFGSSKRQYMSAMFCHDDKQLEIASESLERRKKEKNGRCATVVEMATDFYEAEAYHQKWLLQRKPDWFRTLGLTDARDMIESHAASRLTAYVSGAISFEEMRNMVDGWARDGVVSNDVWSNVRTRLMRDCTSDE